MDLRHVADLELSAASGVVVRGSRLYVVSDDELALGVFDTSGRRLGLAPLSDERLPEDPVERKAAKADLEALAELPDGTLLALGSGATARRERGWVWPLDGAAREISLSTLYTALRRELDDLNIEGAAVVGDRIWLAQRGNGAHGCDALIELALADPIPAEPLAIHRCAELGDVNGVPLTLSDLAPLPDGRLLFCAVAEDTDSTYYDGPCVGAAVGIIRPGASEPDLLELLPEPHKVEGVALAGDELVLVADPDDPNLPSPLLQARVSFG